jgi:hypothetical protein
MNSGLAHKCCSIKCISWTAIFVGSIVGVGLGFLLNLFSVAIGLTAYSTSSTGVAAFAVGGFIGFLIGGMIASFVAGYTSGYLAHPHCPKRNSGALYGFTTWALTLIFMVILSGPIARYVVNTTRFVTNTTLVQRGMTTPTAMQATTDEESAKKAASDMSQAAFAVFVLAFLSALAGSFGGHFGMVCRPEDCANTTTTTNRM